MILNVVRKKQILELGKILTSIYIDYLNVDEINNVNFICDNINFVTLSLLKEFFYPILDRIWTNELDSGRYKVISWNKYAGEKRKGDITFATLSCDDNIISFCNMVDGIEYKITFDSLFGAINRDGATVFNSKDDINEYTVAVIGNNAVNSYNYATKFITPYQLVNSYDKYNELILDSSKIVELGRYEYVIPKV